MDNRTREIIHKIEDFISECGFDEDDEGEIKGYITLLEDKIDTLEKDNSFLREKISGYEEPRELESRNIN